MKICLLTGRRIQTLGASFSGQSALERAPIQLAFSYLLAFPGTSFISVPHLGPCSFRMSIHGSFLSNALLPLVYTDLTGQGFLCCLTLS